MNLFDRLTRRVKDRIKSFDESGMGYWRIKAVLADGRIFTNVYINDFFHLGFPDETPFKLRDIVDVMWDGYRGSESSALPRELVSTAPISPWTDVAALPSPDGHKRATIVNADEIAMGGPTSGTVAVTGGREVVRVDGCNPSMVWSEDSRRLAIPQWTRTRMQKLVIVDSEAGTFTAGATEYRVLQLERFEHGVVHAVDSPIHAPARIEIAIGQ